MLFRGRMEPQQIRARDCNGKPGDEERVEDLQWKARHGEQVSKVTPHCNCRVAPPKNYFFRNSFITIGKKTTSSIK
jgi:hypothetical protein